MGAPLAREVGARLLQLWSLGAMTGSGRPCLCLVPRAPGPKVAVVAGGVGSTPLGMLLGCRCIVLDVGVVQEGGSMDGRETECEAMVLVPYAFV